MIPLGGLGLLLQLAGPPLLLHRLQVAQRGVDDPTGLPGDAARQPRGLAA